NAINLKNCRQSGKRSLFGAEIHASNVIALQFGNSFARSSIVKVYLKSNRCASVCHNQHCMPNLVTI
ncbi:MAG: hypothetical protein ABIR84_02855, partial [Candidatus Nitrotoga sp.]